VCHPTTLIEALEAAARIHYQAANDLPYDKPAANAAQMAGDHAKTAAEFVRDHQGSLPGVFPDIPFGPMIALFGAACRLQLIPLKTGMDIIERTEN
jgi:hypothetical protein